jgi:hypothetical protein
VAPRTVAIQKNQLLRFASEPVTFSFKFRRIWSFANRRYFTFKATNISRRCAKQTETETVHPAQSAGESR